MELISMRLSNRYEPLHVPERFNRPIQRKTVPKGYEQLHLDYYDFELVKDFIDYWGLLYLTPTKDSELKYIEDYQSEQFESEEHFQNTVKKAIRQEARQPFFKELKTKTLKDMSPNAQ